MTVRERDLAAQLATVTTRLRALTAAHQRLRVGVWYEAQALVGNGVLCRGGTNAALARLRLPPVDESEPMDALTFEVTVSVQVTAHNGEQAHTRALRIVMADQANLRNVTADADPTICVVGPPSPTDGGPTRFAVEADLHLTIHIESGDGPVPWTRAQRRLETDLSRLRRARPDLEDIRQVDARPGRPDPDADDPDKYDPYDD
jgi:hypothetical protein